MGILSSISGGIVLFVLAFAAIQKARRFESTTDMLTGFGLRFEQAHSAAKALILVELSLSLLILAPWTHRAGFALAAFTFLTFAAGLTTQLLRGRKPNCACFGELGNGPISWRTVTRALVLAILSGLALVSDTYPWNYLINRTRDSWADTGSNIAVVSALALFFSLAATCVAFASLKRLGDVLRLLEARGIDVEFPGTVIRSELTNFAVMSSEGSTTVQSLLQRGLGLCLLFVDNACQPCQELLDDLSASTAKYARPLIVFQNQLMDEEPPKLVQTLPPGVWLASAGWTIRPAIEISVHPSAIMTNESGVTIGDLAKGGFATRRMIRSMQLGSIGQRGAVNSEIVPSTMPLPKSAS